MGTNDVVVVSMDDHFLKPWDSLDRSPAGGNRKTALGHGLGRTVCFMMTIAMFWALGVPVGVSQDNYELEADAPEGHRSRQRIIEEVIVTASRREERIRDVPISMSVFDSEFLAQQNVVDYKTLGSFIPNVSFSGSSRRISPKVRGFGSPADLQQARSFEQAVALIIDGIPYSRSEYFQTGLYDLDRLEVLRGPQGTLFGKNASVGSFNLSTRSPADEFSGFLDVQGGEFDRRRVEGAIGGPAIPGFLNFRIAGLSDEQDGYMRNTTAHVDPAANRRLGEQDRRGIRVKLQFPDLLGVDFGLSYERFNADFAGKNLEFRRVPENMRPFFLRYDPNTNFEPGNWIGSVDTKTPTTIDIETFVASANYVLGDWGLEARAGWTEMEFHTVGDSDQTPAPAFNSTFRERTPQLTVEALIHSPPLPGFFGLESLFGLPLGSTDFTAGVLYQRQRFDPIFVSAGVSTVIVAEMIAFDESESGVPFSFLLPPGPPAKDNPEEEGEGIERSFGKFEQENEVLAVFGQMNWRFSDQWSALLGMRLQSESKDARWDRNLSDNAVVLRAAGFQVFTEELDRSDVEFAPKIGVQFEWTDDLHFFATWSRGFRAGGFNSSAVNNDDREHLEYDAESVVSWDLGAKTELFGGAARLDVTLYYMTLKDFQLDTSIPVGSFDVPTVQNAGEVRARGVEVEGHWLPTHWLTFRGSTAYNDTEKVEFPFGLCEQDRPNTDGDDDPRCDLSGKPLTGAPKWTATLISEVSHPLSAFLPGFRGDFLGGIEIRGALTVEWQDKHFLRETLDPRTQQESFLRLNASIGLANPGSGWDLSFTVQNLTNESVSTFVDNVSLARDTFVQFPDPPRQMFGSFRWSF